MTAATVVDAEPTRAGAYRAILGARFRMLLQYRLAAVAGAGTQFFWGCIRIMILSAFYAGGGTEAPMSLGAVVTYIWLGQAFLGLLPWNHDRELESMIRTGQVSYELVRPLDLYSLWYVRTLAMRTAGTSLRCLPIFFGAGLILPLAGLGSWGLALPPSLTAGALFLLALSAGVALGCAITMLVHVSMMWTLSGEGLSRLMPSIVTVFSGMVVPLPLFPDWAQPVLNILPFRGLADVPFRIYTGHIAAAESLAPIALSLVWTVLLVFVGRVMLVRGQRRLVVQGG